MEREREGVLYYKNVKSPVLISEKDHPFEIKNATHFIICCFM